MTSVRSNSGGWREHPASSNTVARAARFIGATVPNRPRAACPTSQTDPLPKPAIPALSRYDCPHRFTFIDMRTCIPVQILAGLTLAIEAHAAGLALVGSDVIVIN